MLIAFAIIIIIIVVFIISITLFILVRVFFIFIDTLLFSRNHINAVCALCALCSLLLTVLLILFTFSHHVISIDYFAGVYVNDDCNLFCRGGRRFFLNLTTFKR